MTETADEDAAFARVAGMLRARGLWLGLCSCAFVALLASAGDAAASGCERVSALEAFAVSGADPSGASCATFLNEAAQTGVACHWAFGFRDVAAIRFANALWRELTTCRDGQAKEADLQVNHPDSYDMREWSTGDDLYSVSVKDKSALRKTFVFLKFQ